MAEYELRNVPLTEIVVGERFRKDYGDLDDLVESMQVKGVLQPITLNKHMELQAGGRRYKAAAMAGIEEIPAIIRNAEGELDLREVELDENLHRKDMEWHEKVELMARINELGIEKHGKKWSLRKMSEKTERGLGTLSQDLNMAAMLEQMPELKKLKKQSDAIKVIKRLRDKHETAMLREAQKKELASGSTSAGSAIVQHADAHFRIGDAFEEIEGLINTYKKMKTRSAIKLVEVDPPYAIDLAEMKKKGTLTPEELEIYKEIDKEHYPNWLKRLAKLLYEVTADDAWVIFWHGPTWHTEVFTALREAGFKVDDIPGIWVKGEEDSDGQGQTMQPDLYLGRAYEPFAIARKGSVRLRRPGRTNVFNYKPVPPSQKYHPTQRPVELMDDILETFAWPNTVVLIPFLGSGVTLRSCYRQDMRGFGYELNEHNKDKFLLSLEDDRVLHAGKEKDNESEPRGNAEAVSGDEQSSDS